MLYLRYSSFLTTERHISFHRVDANVAARMQIFYKLKRKYSFSHLRENHLRKYANTTKIHEGKVS